MSQRPKIFLSLNGAPECGVVPHIWTSSSPATMGRTDPRNAIIAMLCVAVAAVFFQLIRGHQPSIKSKTSLAESQPLCPHLTAPQTSALQTTAPMYDLGPYDESISQGLKLDYALKLLYCSTPKGGKQEAEPTVDGLCFETTMASHLLFTGTTATTRLMLRLAGREQWAMKGAGVHHFHRRLNSSSDLRERKWGLWLIQRAACKLALMHTHAFDNPSLWRV